jgi:hypothetical protein
MIAKPTGASRLRRINESEANAKGLQTFQSGKKPR